MAKEKGLKTAQKAREFVKAKAAFLSKHEIIRIEGKVYNVDTLLVDGAASNDAEVKQAYTALVTAIWSEFNGTSAVQTLPPDTTTKAASQNAQDGAKNDTQEVVDKTAQETAPETAPEVMIDSANLAQYVGKTLRLTYVEFGNSIIASTDTMESVSMEVVRIDKSEKTGKMMIQLESGEYDAHYVGIPIIPQCDGELKPQCRNKMDVFGNAIDRAGLKLKYTFIDPVDAEVEEEIAATDTAEEFQIDWNEF